MLKIKKYCKIDSGGCSLNGIPYFCKNEDDTLKSFLGGLHKYTGTDYAKFFKMDSLSKTGFLLAELLLKEEKTASDSGETALFFANSAASLDTDKCYQKTIGDEYFPSPSLFVYTLANIVLGEICIRHKIQGENTFFVSPSFQIRQLQQYVEAAFSSSDTERALVGWLNCHEERYEAFAMLVYRKCEGIDFEETKISALYNH